MQEASGFSEHAELRRVVAAHTSSFAELVRQTPCPFAHLAHWWNIQPTIHGPGWRKLAQQSAAEIGQAVLLAPERLDMIVVTIDDHDLSTSLGGLTSVVHVLMHTLTHQTHQSQGSPHTSEANVQFDHPSWQLVVGEIPLFGMAFAPLYPQQHPRYSPTDSAYVVLQLERSFSKRGISSHIPGRAKLSDFVRECFERNGIPYFADLTRTAPKSFRLIKPIALSDPPVRWWQEQSGK